MKWKIAGLLTPIFLFILGTLVSDWTSRGERIQKLEVQEAADTVLLQKMEGDLVEIRDDVREIRKSQLEGRRR